MNKLLVALSTSALLLTGCSSNGGAESGAKMVQYQTCLSGEQTRYNEALKNGSGGVIKDQSANHGIEFYTATEYAILKCESFKP